MNEVKYKRPPETLFMAVAEEPWLWTQARIFAIGLLVLLAWCLVWLLFAGFGTSIFPLVENFLPITIATHPFALTGTLVVALGWLLLLATAVALLVSDENRPVGTFFLCLTFLLSIWICVSPAWHGTATLNVPEFAAVALIASPLLFLAGAAILAYVAIAAALVCYCAYCARALVLVPAVVRQWVRTAGAARHQTSRGFKQ